MLIRIRNKRGHSLIMWTTTFAVAVAAITIIQSFLKLGTRKKVKETVNYLFWTMWGQEEEFLSGNGANMRAKSVGKPLAPYRAGVLETDEGEIIRGVETEQRKSRISSGVNAGSEAYLKAFDLNNAFDIP
jgi:hypothetical protein